MRLEAKVPVHIFSLSEKAAREAHTTHREALFEHNRSAMMRIYPFAFRVTSSNLDPSFYWRRGAQLVALNWQNLDKGMMLNHGMFVGTPGWELKPLGYRSQASSSNVIRLETLDLTIQVFAAQNLSLPEDDHSERWFRPYVNCQLHVEEPEDPAAAGHDDASTESEKSSYRRCTKSSSGCNPDFDGQKLTFPTVAGIMEELSFVRLVLSFPFFASLFLFCSGFLHPRCCSSSHRITTLMRGAPCIHPSRRARVQPCLATTPISGFACIAALANCSTVQLPRMCHLFAPR